MDLFNKKKTESLERDLGVVWSRLAQQEKDLKELEKPRCFNVGDSLPDNSVLNAVCKVVRALEEYLKVEIKWEWEDDPMFLKPEHPKRRVWRAYRKTNKFPSTPK